MAGRDKPYYGLGQIRRFVLSGKFEIDDRAKKSAEKAFGWNKNDIKNALLKLQPKHFDKSVQRWSNPEIYQDSYRARGLMGENVYTHFHIEDNTLTIESFKEI